MTDQNPLEGKTIVLTGGTGSFGNAFADYVLSTCQKVTLRVLSRDELKQYAMSERLRDSRVRYLLGDVRDLDRLRRALEGADLVVHAAALKQVPACEYNPFEAVKTNILGAENLIEACLDVGVPQLLGISTDKAVNPINLYGATKLCAEKLFVDANAYAGGRRTHFSVVRYGNVVGSRGSVVNLFHAQRAKGRLTITDPRMTRFWITLDQAVKFVVSCVTWMERGEIFVPKIPSMRITDLARVMAPDATVEVVGIRPGEKLHEILLTADESRHALEFDDRYLILPAHGFFAHGQFPEGKPLPADFSYTSDNNALWLTDAEMLAMVPRSEASA